MRYSGAGEERVHVRLGNNWSAEKFAQKGREDGIAVAVDSPPCIEFNRIGVPRGGIIIDVPLGVRRSPRVSRIAWEGAVIVVDVHQQRAKQLPLVVHALEALGLDPGFLKGRQQDRDQKRNDSDNHQQLNERKTLRFPAKCHNKSLSLTTLALRGPTGKRVHSRAATRS